MDDLIIARWSGIHGEELVLMGSAALRADLQHFA